MNNYTYKQIIIRLALGVILVLTILGAIFIEHDIRWAYTAIAVVETLALLGYAMRERYHGNLFAFYRLSDRGVLTHSSQYAFATHHRHEFGPLCSDAELSAIHMVSKAKSIEISTDPDTTFSTYRDDDPVIEAIRSAYADPERRDFSALHAIVLSQESHRYLDSAFIRLAFEGGVPSELPAKYYLDIAGEHMRLNSSSSDGVKFSNFAAKFQQVCLTCTNILYQHDTLSLTIQVESSSTQASDIDSPLAKNIVEAFGSSNLMAMQNLVAEIDSFLRGLNMEQSDTLVWLVIKGLGTKTYQFLLQEIDSYIKETVRLNPTISEVPQSIEQSSLAIR